MRERIKQIFHLLRKERKDSIRILLADRYSMSVDSVKNMWIYAGKTPKKYQDEVLEILEEELKNQIEEDKKILADD